MITFEEAVKIAKSKMSQVNKCNEDDLAYIFYYDDGDDVIRIGGFGSPCAVLKKDGQALHMAYYVMHYHGGDIIKTYDID